MCPGCMTQGKHCSPTGRLRSLLLLRSRLGVILLILFVAILFLSPLSIIVALLGIVVGILFVIIFVIGVPRHVLPLTHSHRDRPL